MLGRWLPVLLGALAGLAACNGPAEPSPASPVVPTSNAPAPSAPPPASDQAPSAPPVADSAAARIVGAWHSAYWDSTTTYYASGRYAIHEHGQLTAGGTYQVDGPCSGATLSVQEIGARPSTHPISFPSEDEMVLDEDHYERVAPAEP